MTSTEAWFAAVVVLATRPTTEALPLIVPAGAEPTAPRRRTLHQDARAKGEAMPLFLVERNFAEELELGADDVLGITAVNDDIGVPDDRWGETVKALVVLAAGATATEAELIDHCRARLTHYKCPTSVEFRETLPRTATGKLQKFKLRSPYWEGRERQVN